MVFSHDLDCLLLIDYHSPFKYVLERYIDTTLYRQFDFLYFMKYMFFSKEISCWRAVLLQGPDQHYIRYLVAPYHILNRKGRFSRAKAVGISSAQLFKSNAAKSKESLWFYSKERLLCFKFKKMNLN